jgi:SseB protein N-terminal domain
MTHYWCKIRLFKFFNQELFMDISGLQALLNTNVHVLGLMSDSGEIVLQNGRASFGTPAIPFFTTQQFLVDAVDPGQQCLSMPCKTFLALAAGNAVVQNPKSSSRKDYSAADVHAALQPQSGSTLAGKVKSIFGFNN